MYGLMRRRSMMAMALPVPTERLIYSLTDYTCDGTVNTFIDTGIKLFGLEYESFRIEMEYDGLDLTTANQETLIECKSFIRSPLTNGLTVKVSDSAQSAHSNALAINIYPCIDNKYFKNTSSATVILTYDSKSCTCSINVNGSTKTGSGITIHTEPFTIGGRYSSHLSNPDRFVQVHISSLKIYATPSSIDTSYIYLPLTFKCLTGGNLSIKNGNGSYDRNFEYSLNDGAWTAFDLPKNTASKLIATLSPNDTISFRRDNENFADAQFISDSNLTFDIYGNLLSLQYGSAFNGQTELRNTSKKAFGATFSGTNVVDASKLMLTAPTLSASCYYGMFHSCYRLIAAPALYATKLAEDCCRNMFRYCSSLKSLPKFYGTNLAKNCYNGMFGGTAIETIPSGYLSSATTMAESCYSSMFKGCTSLITVPGDLLPSTSLANSCYLSMFDSCTSLTTAPELPAITLVQLCYKSMFEHCTSLNYIKCLATDISATNCVAGWVNSVPNTGTFVKASGVTWPSGSSGIPNGWTVIEE